VVTANAPLSLVSGTLSIDLSAYATLASPALTGTPTAPTAAPGTNSTQLATTAFVLANVPIGVLRNYIDGLMLAWVSATSFSVAVGQAADSANAILMNLAAAITKTTAAWVIGTGNGGLDTGAIAASTWYHVHLIRRSDTGVVDVLYSISVSAPTMPASYNQRRRIGSVKTNASSQFINFLQVGERFQWIVPVQDISGVAPAPTTYILPSIPTGVRVLALLQAFVIDQTSAVTYARLVSPEVSDTGGPSVALGSFGIRASPLTDTGAYAIFSVLTDTAAQVRAVVSSVANTRLSVAVYGWDDPRGKNS
jgi:hypothetical protein